MLRHRGHECWTAGSAGLARAKDDELTVWAAEHQAVIISTDGEFGQRRMQSAIGRQVWLRCSDWEASEVLADHLNEVVNGQVAVPGGGQLKVPTPRVDQVLFRVVPFLALASRMR